MTENSTRSGALVEMARGLGRIEGMVGQALTSLTDHEKRISALETDNATRKGQIAVVATIVSGGIAAAAWVIEHWDLFN